MNGKNTFSSKLFTHRSDILFFVCGVVMLISEIWKQLVLTFAVGHGSYNWWYFPFQLCSIPMYVLLALPWLRRDMMRRTALVFLMSYGLLGGIAAFADTSGLHYPLAALTLHSFSWHILLILIGTGAGAAYISLLHRDGKKTLFSRTLACAFPLRPFLYSSLFYLLCCLAAEIFNLSLDRFGTINMFYINPAYRMQQIVFRDLVPVIGNPAAISLYIAVTVLGAFLLFLLWKLVFRLSIR